MVLTPATPTSNLPRVLDYWRARGAVYEGEHARLGLVDRARFRWQERVLARELARRSPASILDVGCGYGRLLAVAARAAPDAALAGCDPSPAQLAAAARRVGPSVSLREAALPDLPYEDGAFDLVLCSEVLMHLPPSVAAPAVAELERVARRSVVTIGWRDPRAPAEAGGYCWQHDVAAFHGPSWSTRTTTLRPVTKQDIVVATRGPR